MLLSHEDCGVNVGTVGARAVEGSWGSFGVRALWGPVSGGGEYCGGAPLVLELPGCCGVIRRYNCVMGGTVGVTRDGKVLYRWVPEDTMGSWDMIRHRMVQWDPWRTVGDPWLAGATGML